MGKVLCKVGNLFVGISTIIIRRITRVGKGEFRRWGCSTGRKIYLTLNSNLAI